MLKRFMNRSIERTLRVSKKNGKNKPKIVFKTGKTNKLIAEYMDVYEHFKRL
jgi:hypothetical protein